jgi:hypothetical protein
MGHLVLHCGTRRICGDLPTSFLSVHGQINYIDIKAKCRHLKQLTCKGPLQQVFIRVYRQEICTVSHVGIFDPAL